MEIAKVSNSSTAGQVRKWGVGAGLGVLGLEAVPFLSASVPFAQVQRIQSHLLFEYLRFSERQMVSLELVGMTGIFNELVTKKIDSLPAG